jgi:hypothetical protein
LFEREAKYGAFFLPGPSEMDPDEAIRLALHWLVSQPGDPLILFHAKKMINNNRLVAEGARRYGIPVEAPRTLRWSDWSGGAIVAPWASDDVLRFIDDDLSGKPKAVCVVGWIPGAHDRWIAAREAADLRGGAAVRPKEDLISDPVVRIAIDHASHAINHNNALVQAEDKAYVILTLQELVRGGHRFDIDELVSYAMATGWTGEEVKRLEDYGNRVLSGRRFRLRSQYGPGPGSCGRWEEEALQ